MEQFELQQPHAGLLRCSFMLSSLWACPELCSALCRVCPQLWGLALHPPPLHPPPLHPLPCTPSLPLPWQHLTQSCCCIAALCLGAAGVEDGFLLGSVASLWDGFAATMDPEALRCSFWPRKGTSLWLQCAHLVGAVGGVCVLSGLFPLAGVQAGQGHPS